MDNALYSLAKSIGDTLLTHGMRVVVTESCTGGWVSKALTDVPGSSNWFEAGLVTYSNQAKQTLLGVSEQILAAEGAVSRAAVEAMASGALQRHPAHVAVAVSGIAGPEGGSDNKPVGTVWFAWAGVIPQRIRVHCEQFHGDRETVRRLSVITALEGLLSFIVDMREQGPGGAE